MSDYRFVRSPGAWGSAPEYSAAATEFPSSLTPAQPGDLHRHSNSPSDSKSPAAPLPPPGALAAKHKPTRHTIAPTCEPRCAAESSAQPPTASIPAACNPASAAAHDHSP